MLKMREGELVVAGDPLETLLAWLDEAKAAGLPEPTAMTLATATRDGFPSARIVLFKGLSGSSMERRGLEFYTNYESRKSKQLEDNPQAALVFHWTTMRRQVRIEGRVEKVTPEESYVARLFHKGINKIAQKVGEEAVETVIEAKDNNDDLFLNESADLLFHYLILLNAKGYRLKDIADILQQRHAK